MRNLELLKKSGKTNCARKSSRNTYLFDLQRIYDVTTTTFVCVFLSRFSGNVIYGPRPIIEHDFGPAASKGCRPLI